MFLTKGCPLTDRLNAGIRFHASQLHDLAVGQELQNRVIEAYLLNRATAVDQEDAPALGLDQFRQMGDLAPAEVELGRNVVNKVIHKFLPF